ncbi:MAG: formate--tetrahydrofolate ligase [Verrucomicrobiales bacterium]|nr:formate--tetrahydrofolate ligase [Verrucomicrobiales bacterium]
MVSEVSRSAKSPSTEIAEYDAIWFSGTGQVNLRLLQEGMTDIEIARGATLQPIADLAKERLDLDPERLIPYGKYKAKLIPESSENQTGKLILVTAISPTPAGEGKTTTTVGLGDGLNRIGKKTMICLREPSLGPSFGMKGGAAGGGHAQVVPMDEINLHFTGDFHAISAANNLLSAMIDNHLHWGNRLKIDLRKISWRRAVDLNDRSLRHLLTGLGNGNGFATETGADITVASEVMAIFCLAKSLADLKARLGRIVVGRSLEKEDVLASDLKAHGAMTALLKDAIRPNLVQTLEQTPALVHGGPFANIAHGCNSVIATQTALGLADYVVTEAGFGADLGAEKFFDIKCRKAGLTPEAAVVVATIRALKFHGGVERKDLETENVEAVERGFANLERHLENIGKFGVPAIVAVNAFDADTEAETEKLQSLCEDLGVRCVLARHWAEGGKGAEDLARAVVSQVEEKDGSSFAPLYPDELPLAEKIRTVAREIYRADDIEMTSAVERQLSQWDKTEAGKFPVCIGKTPYSFSADPEKRGAATGFTLPVTSVRRSAGAGFVVALTGEIMTMPGLPRVPAAERIDVDESGEIVGLS